MSDVIFSSNGRFYRVEWYSNYRVGRMIGVQE